MNQNSTRNPFDGTSAAPSILDERHTVAVFNPDFGPSVIGIRLKGAPLQNSIPPVDIWTIDTLALGNRLVQLTEIPSGSPALNQYRVDYGTTAQGFASAMVWINIPAGLFVSADYRTQGDIVSVENVERMIDEKLAVVSTAVLRGSMNLKLSRHSTTQPPRIEAASTWEIDGGVHYAPANIDPTFAGANYGNGVADPSQWYILLGNDSGGIATHIQRGTVQTIGSLVIASITDQGASVSRIAFSGGPNLSVVLANEVLEVFGATNPANIGVFRIIAVDNGAKTIDVANSNVVNQAGTGGTANAWRATGDAPGGGALTLAAVPRDYEELVFDNTINGFVSPYAAFSAYRALGFYRVNGSGVVDLWYALGNGREWQGGEGMKIGTPFEWLVNHVPPWGIETDSAIYTIASVPIVAKIAQVLPDSLWLAAPVGGQWKAPPGNGFFKRIHNNGAGIDPDFAARTFFKGGVGGDQLWTDQASQFGNHSHSPSYNNIGGTFGGGGSSFAGGPFGIAAVNLSIGASGGNETRPRNLYVKQLLKVG